MLDLSRIKAITLDLDDTLWPIWPTIERAEQALDHWLRQHAPASAALFADRAARHHIREELVRAHPELGHHMSFLRRESIRQTLLRCGDDQQLAEPAFEVFFAERHRVTLFDDALPALAFLASRFPLVSVSNGNADLQRIGIASYFKASLSAQAFGVGKPDARIFHAAALAAGVAPGEVLHVGDDAALDVVPALACGMQAVWVNRVDHPWTHPVEPHETVLTLTELCDLLKA